jgi:hypothetical protein
MELFQFFLCEYVSKGVCVCTVQKLFSYQKSLQKNVLKTLFYDACMGQNFWVTEFANFQLDILVTTWLMNKFMLLSGCHRIWVAIISVTQEVESWQIVIWGLPGQKISETLSQQIIQAWCQTPVVPATQEDHGLRLTPGKNAKPDVKNL